MSDNEKKIAKQASKEDKKQPEELLESDDEEVNESFANFSAKSTRKDGSGSQKTSKDGGSLSGSSTSSGSKYGKLFK